MKFLDSKKATMGLIAMGFVGIVIFACLYCAGGDPDKFAALLNAAMEPVKWAVGALGVAIAGQAAVDVKKPK